MFLKTVNNTDDISLQDGMRDRGVPGEKVDIALGGGVGGCSFQNNGG